MKQFSIRDLLLLIAVVALAVGWWGERRNRATSSSRYQLQMNGNHAFVVDTTTGQVWEKYLSSSRGMESGGFSDPKVEK